MPGVPNPAQAAQACAQTQTKSAPQQDFPLHWAYPGAAQAFALYIAIAITVVAWWVYMKRLEKKREED